MNVFIIQHYYNYEGNTIYGVYRDFKRARQELERLFFHEVDSYTQRKDEGHLMDDEIAPEISIVNDTTFLFTGGGGYFITECFVIE